MTNSKKRKKLLSEEVKCVMQEVKTLQKRFKVG